MQQSYNRNTKSPRTSLSGFSGPFRWQHRGKTTFLPSSFVVWNILEGPSFRVIAGHTDPAKDPFWGRRPRSNASGASKMNVFLFSNIELDWKQGFVKQGVRVGFRRNIIRSQENLTRPLYVPRKSHVFKILDRQFYVSWVERDLRKCWMPSCLASPPL